MENCIFCKIVNHEIPAAIVYEDEKAMAFLTIEEVNEGHLLIIPTMHVEHVHEMDDELHAHVMKLSKKLSHAVEKAFGPKKVGLMVSGWEIPHAHIHIVPMSVPSDVTSQILLEGRGLKPSSEELDQQAERIRNQLQVDL